MSYWDKSHIECSVSLMEKCLSRKILWRGIFLFSMIPFDQSFLLGRWSLMHYLVICTTTEVFLGSDWILNQGEQKAACYICFPGSTAHKTASLHGEVGGSSIPWDVWEMACVFIWPWFHLTQGPPGFNDTLGHRRFKPLTTVFIPMSQPVGTGKSFTPVYTTT